MMIDFIDYVVTELKSKRLSKTNALSLIKQYSKGASSVVPHNGVVHPLAQYNTSNFSQQSYSSVFTGEEFFLNDHRVQGNKILPAVAYLEMVRAAIENAVPEQANVAVLEFFHVIWAQPVNVADVKTVTVALFTIENTAAIQSAGNRVDTGGQVFEFEIYSTETSGAEIIHCQGRALIGASASPVQRDLPALQQQMQNGVMDGQALYSNIAQAGIELGPSHRGVNIVYRGQQQLLAAIALPSVVDATLDIYRLHPSMMDSAVQAGMSLIRGEILPGKNLPEKNHSTTQPPIPFALDRLRFFSSCTRQMFAWIRYADGSGPGDKVIKLDIDLCDADGNVCVQLLGFSARALTTEIGWHQVEQDDLSSQISGCLIAAPVWESLDQATTGAISIHTGFHSAHILLCDIKGVDSEQLAQSLSTAIPAIRCLDADLSSAKTLAENYHSVALACFETIKAILSEKPQGRVLFQVVVAAREDHLPLLGITSLLKTAGLENPNVVGQLVVVDDGLTTEKLASQLLIQQQSFETLIRWQQGEPQVLRWRNLVDEQANPPTGIFKDHGVYLITGGLGGLGILFAKEILENTTSARVIVTGRSKITAAKKSLLDALAGPTGLSVEYRQLDLENLVQVQECIHTIIRDFGQLNGIIHAAGMISDNFILKKNAEEFSAVLAPKVAGTYNLDQATSNMPLDFLVLFSSGVSVFGNAGQADYAAANGFMDSFAQYRNALVASHQRCGVTVSLNWPLWRDGGMKPDEATQAALRVTTGMFPMQTSTGMRAFYRSLTAGKDQLLVVEGDLAVMQATLLNKHEVRHTNKKPEPIAPAVLPAAVSDDVNLPELTQEYLRKQFSVVLKLPAHKIDVQAPLENYGIDSILAMDLTSQLEQTFGSLPKTLFFEYQTIQELTQYVIKTYADKLSRLLVTSTSHSTSHQGNPGELLSVPPVQQHRALAALPSARRSRRQRLFANPISVPAQQEAEPIAIIGLSGRYPEAWNIEEYWNNLRDGKDCIVEVPGDRWDWREYYSEDRTQDGHHYSKWGGFIQGVDEFDPIFFGIPPAGAELIDPQERLFLEHAWMAMEDAGYTRARLQQIGKPGSDEMQMSAQVGVYVGVMYGEYQIFGAEASLHGQRMGLPVSYASIANRVSYVLNLHGPSMTLDTMCSSSLTAIHLACQDLKQGRTGLAIAGGVNVTIHPNKYLLLSAGQFISGDGHCQSFGEGGDGYIPGEGVGAVILKRLSEAKADKNIIYGVIKGTALNHGGKTNGYSVPNPQAQASVITQALLDARIDARHISYLEAHGTGTKLGDPIEIAALAQAFYRSENYPKEFGFCLIGSAKSNIGHCESAAGIAGLTKVLLQMKHRQIVPSLHSRTLNPHIDFSSTPFIVNQILTEWKQPEVDGKPIPRIAGISSFGAGGSNAHIVVEEYQQVDAVLSAPHGPLAVPLSARTEDQLRQKAIDLLRFIENSSTPIDLQALAYTLQIGREAMEERLAFLVTSLDELTEKLRAFLDDEQHVDNIYRGQVKRNQEGMALISQDEDMGEAIEKWIARRKINKLLDLWTKGLVLDWNKFYQDAKPAFISLPAYPFSREKYWVNFSRKDKNLLSHPVDGARLIHPLVHINTSDFFQQSYSTRFTGRESFLNDHQLRLTAVGDQKPVVQKVLPAVAYLEMVRAAIEQAASGRSDGKVLELCNLAWINPLIVAEEDKGEGNSRVVSITLWPQDNETIDFEIYSTTPSETATSQSEVMHCQGQARFTYRPESEIVDPTHLASAMQQGKIEPQQLYELYEAMGIYYGPSYRGVKTLYRGTQQILAEIHLPEEHLDRYSADHYVVLHPALMDSSLQAAIGLMSDTGTPPDRPMVPFALDSISILSACPSKLYAWIRHAENYPQHTLMKLDIDLIDPEGNICVQMRGLTSRALTSGQTSTAEKTLGITKDSNVNTLLAVPIWQESQEVTTAENLFGEHHIILCSFEASLAEKLSARLTLASCLPLMSEGNIADDYTNVAIECFTCISSILKRKPRDKVLIQIVVSHEQEQSVHAGLSGLLKSVALENPGIVGQVVLTNPEINAEELVKQIQRASANTRDAVIQYQNERRLVLAWQEVTEQPEHSQQSPAVVPGDNKVYLITGGLGGLGMLFARHMLEQAQDNRIIFAGRSALTEEKQQLLDALSTPQHHIQYHQTDVSDPLQVDSLIKEILREHGRINGIIHSAGVIRDNFLINKTLDEYRQVLAPKVSGTFNLDQATKDLSLDFLVLFSSVSGAMGNYGQADYAVANGFMDQFARYRNQLVATQQRQGKTVSINWPLWKEGGMTLDKDSLRRVRESIGMVPLQTMTGIRSFYQSLAMPYDQILVMEGDLQLMRSRLFPSLPPETAVKDPDTLGSMTGRMKENRVEAGALLQKTREYLVKEFASLLKLPVHEVDVKAPLENYGIDSILAMKLTSRLEETFGSLSKTLFFEYQSIAELADYIARSFPLVLQEKFRLRPVVSTTENVVLLPESHHQTRLHSRKNRLPQTSAPQQEIAIVGLAGRYPQADSLQEFWDNLKAGRDCITDVPAERWDNSRYFNPKRNQPGKTYSKWGGFLNHIDKFDALFFNVSPKEAELIDPQERLFMETVWETIEDAGYSKESVSGKRIGVYVGVMWGQYELFGAESILVGNNPVPTSSYASVANRVSYFFNFYGPSIALDTMCSSSITAIHMASEDIRRGEVEAAIAGGVNLSLHPHKYLNLSQGGFHASDGRCRSFGEGGDGYVPGEGVGAVFLKPLDQALADGDQVYGVIKASSINHGGKSNGYTVPNPNAQASLILDALKKARIEPASLSYLETHGTGTSLGDPIEITGLGKAFAAFQQDGTAKQYCPIGSVKSNIGHLESAAGIAAVTKVLLQLKHRQLVPSLHAETLNPNIDFAQSPFYVQTQLESWKKPAGHPRRTGISSFGAGGSNAHMIIEEYVSSSPQADSDQGPQVFLLSAKNKEALGRYAEKMVDFLCSNAELPLSRIAYTSQVGRTPMNERLAIIASGVEELEHKLRQWLASAPSHIDGDSIEDLFHGKVKSLNNNPGAFIEGEAGRAFLDIVLKDRDFARLAKLWVVGTDIDWSLLYPNETPQRISLPTYPFARERHWFELDRGLLASRVSQEPEAVSAETKAMLYFTPQWNTSQIAHSQTVEDTVTLVFSTSEEFLLAMRDQLGFSCVVMAMPGTGYQKFANGIYTFNPNDEDEFHRFISELAESDQLPRQIIHYVAQSNIATEWPVSSEILTQLHNTFYALVHLCKALIRKKYTASLRLLSIHTDRSAINRSINSALGAFFKTLAMEHPGYQAKVIELITENTDAQNKILIESVKSELLDDSWNEREIRYQFREETVQRYSRTYKVCSPADDAEKIGNMPLKQGGVYIISGGLGGLGYIFSEYLAKHYQARLVLFGRSALDAEKEQRLKLLQTYNKNISYQVADVASISDMQQLVSDVKARFAEINGVIHSAGVHRDALILRKNREDMQDVLQAKIFGTVNLDEATKHEPLDLFVLFSSVAGALGNPGQSDYAYANAFIDAFAESREELARDKQRSGRTLSINWPLWEEGGMTISAENRNLSEAYAGVLPISTGTGIAFWEQIARSSRVQTMALYGFPSKITAYVTQSLPIQKASRLPAANNSTSDVMDTATLVANTEIYLKTLIGNEIKLGIDRIDSDEPFAAFGIDSMAINRINVALESDVGALPKTLFYEYETISELTHYLVTEHRSALTGYFNRNAGESPVVQVADAIPTLTPMASDLPQQVQIPAAQVGTDHINEDIAIIGLHGYFPQSNDLNEYWENLKQGNDLVGLIPSSRWDYEEFYDPDPNKAAEGKIYCKWGAFLEDFDKFDPGFFSIPAEEANSIDPQERLFLQSAWSAIEDAGYTRESLKKQIPKAKSANVSVFVGSTTNSYHMLAAEEWTRGKVVSTGTHPWSIANRVSYVFDFNGPSLAIDTACSSSLVAIHLACESLKKQECHMAIAGGVNLYLHHTKYRSFCQRKMVGASGKNFSFGAGDDGFIPGEGVGAIVLKRLDNALEDRDQIHAVIRASGYDHSGRSNGYSAPNPNAQANLISETLRKGKIHPETISYIEGHGTGTQLGDSLEIAAITKAFREWTDKRQFCPIGSVKANLGHSESAAGISGVAKIIMQLKHKQLAPTIHSKEVNPTIDFDNSPCYLQHRLGSWETTNDHPRRALINSFGAGGVNACLVLEEFRQPAAVEPVSATPFPVAGLIVLSARNKQRLQDYARRLLEHAKNECDVDLANLSYTLQTGREAMQERLAFAANDRQQLISRLSAWIEGDGFLDEGVYRGTVKEARTRKKNITEGKKTEIQNLFHTQNFDALGQMWVRGEDIDWTALYGQNKLPKESLPTYPFAKERYWVSTSSAAPTVAALPTDVVQMPAQSAPAQLHPLVSYNSSTLNGVSFMSLLDKNAFYARDHQVNHQKIFPGAGFLEVACICGSLAGEQRVTKIRDIVWVNPLSFEKDSPLLQTFLKTIGNSTDYEITSINDENERVLHSEGKLYFESTANRTLENDKVSILSLKEKAEKVLTTERCYQQFSAHGFNYGPAFQTIQELYIGDRYALAKLVLQDRLRVDFDRYILHPCLVDGALQAVSGLLGNASVSNPYLPFAIDEIDIIRPLSPVVYVAVEFSDTEGQAQREIRRFDIRIINERGEVLIKLYNFYVRALPVTHSTDNAVAGMKHSD